jgi:single-strand DNA-binding protein
MYNKAFLIGRLTKDPEMRLTQTGISVTRFSLAVDRPGKRNSEEKLTDFFRVVTWRKLAEICNQYLKKGKLVAIEGRLQIDSYEKNGEQISSTEIVADNMQMLDKAGAVTENNTLVEEQI